MLKSNFNLGLPECNASSLTAYETTLKASRTWRCSQCVPRCVPPGNSAHRIILSWFRRFLQSLIKVHSLLFMSAFLLFWINWQDQLDTPGGHPEPSDVFCDNDDDKEELEAHSPHPLADKIRKEIFQSISKEIRRDIHFYHLTFAWTESWF